MNNYSKAFAILFLLFSSCTVNHGDFSVISNKLVNLDDFELGQESRTKRVKGEQVVHLIFGIIPAGAIPTLEGAMDDAF